jgi:hypothetical protein
MIVFVENAKVFYGAHNDGVLGGLTPVACAFGSGWFDIHFYFRGYAIPIIAAVNFV